MFAIFVLISIFVCRNSMTRGNTTLIKYIKNITVALFDNLAAWLLWISQSPCGSLVGRGCPRARWKGFSYCMIRPRNNIFLVKVNNLFYIFIPIYLHHSQNDEITPPPMHHPCGLSSSPKSPPLRRRVFDWLLHLFDAWQLSKATMFYIFVILLPLDSIA